MQEDLDRPLSKVLGKFPQQPPPVDLWPAVEARLNDHSSRSNHSWWLAAAAVVVLTSATALTWLNQAKPPAGHALEQWQAYNLQLEHELRALRSNTSIYRGHHAVAMDTLEDMLREVDNHLAQVPAEQRQLALWQRRATLLHDLVSVHTEGGWMSSELRPVLTVNPPVTLAAYQF